MIFFNSYPPVLFAEVFLGKCMLKMEEQKNYLFMDKEENVFKISEFISKSLSDCLEEGELQELEKWLAEDERHRELFDQWSSTELMEHKVGEYERLDYMKAWEEFRTVRRDKLSAKRRKIRRTWMRYAAMFMIPLGVAVALLSRDDIKEKSRVEPITVKAGKSQAVLVLSSGERQVLDLGERNIEDGGMRISADSGRISYNGKSRLGEVQDAFHILEVPRGGEYFMILEDGTKVWLNAATRLKYPVAFVGGIRKVLLEGEAYFEVAPNSKHPFIVVTEEGMEVKVYGTEFNMNTYQHGVVQTVLVSGKVGIRVNATGKEVMLAPRQMAEYSEKTGMVRVEDTDPYRYIAWKDGEFVFERETIEEIMERLGRWYDVKVFYENESLKQKRFTGVISRYEDIEQVLRLIEGPATLRFEVKGNVVTVKYGQ